jgi:hypothetical protein
MRVKRLKLLDDTPPTDDACLYTPVDHSGTINHGLLLNCTTQLSFPHKKIMPGV